MGFGGVFMAAFFTFLLLGVLNGISLDSTDVEEENLRQLGIIKESDNVFYSAFDNESLLENNRTVVSRWFLLRSVLGFFTSLIMLGTMFGMYLSFLKPIDFLLWPFVFIPMAFCYYGFYKGFKNKKKKGDFQDSRDNKEEIQ